jgi:glc operon protein GlcG
VPVSLGEANQLIAASHEEAKKIGITITTVIVDEGGHVQAAGRMEGAFPLAFKIAQAKAVGAAMWHRDGGSMKIMHAARSGFFGAVDRLGELPLMPGAGSLVLRRDGVVMGAIGISGATSEQDLECAAAAVSAVFG